MVLLGGSNGVYPDGQGPVNGHKVWMYSVNEVTVRESDREVYHWKGQVSKRDWNPWLDVAWCSAQA